MEVNLDLTYTEAQEQIFLDHHPQKYLIITKGRRFGATRGRAQADIEDLLQGIQPLLWVDTIYGNIDRYFDRYFKPVLKQLPSNLWHWSAQRKELRVGDSIEDFRSSDRPENIEGFGYRKIFLNEAGIILKKPELYTKTLLPMLLDFPDSQLTAAGVPKGMYLKDGSLHKFYELYDKCLQPENADTHKLFQFSSYDNPFLTKQDIDELALEVSDEEAQQEIFGQFTESSGNRPFCAQYNPTHHEAPVEWRKDKPLVFTMDINFDPMAICVSNAWREGPKMFDHQFDEFAIENANVFKAADVIKKIYGKYLASAIFIGDSMGNKRDISQRDHASFYLQLSRLLGVRHSQFKIPKANPTHENSRMDTNYVLYHAAEGKIFSYKVNPATCPNSARDYKNVQVDNFGAILKKNRLDINQRADFLDANRYKVHIQYSEWVKRHRVRVKKEIPPRKIVSK